MLALILLFTCVLLIKTCHLSPTVCVTFGFGSTSKGGASLSDPRCVHLLQSVNMCFVLAFYAVSAVSLTGVYLFFIFFALSMLLLLLVVYAINLYTTGRTPSGIEL
eukprot:3802443-Prymnesium_polylepis.2